LQKLWDGIVTVPIEDHTGKDILDRIGVAVFGQNRDKYSFIKDLRSYQRYLAGRKQPTISLTAINKWFDSGSGGPARPKAFQFLLNYLLWTTIRPAAAGQVDQEACAALINELRQTVEFLDEAPVAGLAVSSDGKFAVSTGTTPIDKYTTGRLEPIAGVYQIIRPYTSVVDAYVLEAFSINPHAQNAESMVHMYSHTQPRKKHLYSGPVSANNKYCFATITRTHEDFEGISTSRSFVLDISAAEACVSGLMLRGVTGRSGTWATAVPFVAIKSPYEVPMLLNNEITRLSLGVYEIEHALVLGDIKDNQASPMFEFCDALFKELKPLVHNSNGFSLQTVASRKLCELIDEDASDDGAYFNRWRRAVDASFDRKR
jgi:hypothetical protein